MKISYLVQKLRYYTQFNPFKINFVFFVFFVIVVLRWLRVSHIDTSSFYDLALLMSKIALIVCVLIALISFFSVLISWIYFIVKNDSYHEKAISISMDKDAQKNNTVKVQTEIPKAIKPILGFVKLRLFYDKNQMTEPYLVSGRIKNKLVSFYSGLKSVNALSLPDIKEYHFSKSIIYFEDMLQLFSLSYPCEVNNSICNLPESLLDDINELPPKKTDDEVIRIEQLRKVEGEYLNYKKFEDSDDVRRIVWKIFAKNKELVVRIPEIMDPFASHLYFYASFFASKKFFYPNAYTDQMLNRYKNIVFTLYDALAKKEFAVKYISDQNVHANSSEQDQTQLKITLSDWHSDLHIPDYFKPKHGTVLCIHSLSDVDDVQKIVSSCDQHTTIFFAQLSKLFKSHFVLGWIGRIFFKPSKDNLASLKSKWALQPLKYQVTNNENKILSILKQTEANVEII